MYQIFVKRDLLFVERKNTSPFNRQDLFSVLIRHIIGELEIGSRLLRQNFVPNGVVRVQDSQQWGRLI